MKEAPSDNPFAVEFEFGMTAILNGLPAAAKGRTSSRRLAVGQKQLPARRADEAVACRYPAPPLGGDGHLIDSVDN
jgi:hypothetical protein